MLYPAELRAPALARIRLGLIEPAAKRRLVTGMPPAVLADIGGRALAAEDGGGTVVIGEGAGLQAGAVIVEEADWVGQAPIVQMVAIMACVRQVWGQDRGGEEGGSHEKLRFGHFDSPEVSLGTGAIRSERIAGNLKKVC
jgi:hypothetical protein